MESTSSSCSLNLNISERERTASLLGGSALVLIGLTRRSLGGLALALAGGGLIYRGVTGHCHCYEALGLNTGEDPDIEHNPNASVPHRHGIKVVKSVTIDKSPEELYRFWHNLENLPRFMEHLESVTVQDDKHSHWIARAPAGQKVEWDAEIINDQENRLIAWRSLPGAADVGNAGSVHFTPAPDGRGTEVKVVFEYAPPGGTVVGVAVAKLFGEEPSQQVEADLRRLKELMESGEVPASSNGHPGR